MRIITKKTVLLVPLLWLFIAAWIAPVSAGELAFTAEEQAWLATKPVLRVGADPFWPPYSLADSAGRLTGIDGDMLDLISKRTGIRFDFVKLDSWAAVEDLAREGKLDVLTGTAMTPERTKFARFTRPYVPSAVAIITRRSDTFLTSLRQLEGWRVAVPREHVVTEILASDYPLIELLLTNDQAEALRKVEHGEADATVANLTSANYTILSESLTGLQIAGMTDYAFDIRLAVIAPGPAFTVLDKTLAAISRRDRTEITDRWTGVEFQRAVSRRMVWKALGWAGGVAAVVMLLFVAWNRRLAHELAERRKVERALSSANEALRTAGEEKTALMQMLAHDLRGPLTSLTGICDLFDLQPSSDARVRDDIGHMHSAVERMTRLVNGLLSADAMENGQRKLVLRELDLVTAASRVIERLCGCAEAKNIALHFQKRAACIVRADELALEQIVENLVANAIKFTPRGGRVEVSVEWKDGGGELRVADTGPGVSEEERPHLFKKYSRLSAKPTAGESSHGLGLMLVKRLVEAMNGTVRHEPGKEVGSAFIVRMKA